MTSSARNLFPSLPDVRPPRLGALGITGLALLASLMLPMEPARMQTAAPGGVITNLKLWIKADAGVTGTSPVTAWNDQSGNGNHATTQYGSGTPTLVANGMNFNPVVTFPGLGNLRGNFTSKVTSNNISAFVVMKVLSSAGASSGRAFAIFGTGTDYAGNYGSALFVRSDPANILTLRNGLDLGVIANALDKTGLFGTHFTADNQQVIAYNGTSNAPVAFTTQPFDSDRYAIAGGSTTGGGRSVAGDFAEILLYTADQAAAGTVERIESYLALKYGVSLSHNYVASNGTTIFWDKLANTGYTNDIAGIGRDDGSGLVQRQSQSVNVDTAGNFVTMGLGTIAADNLSNTNNFSADNSFLVWGSDGAATTFTGSIVTPSGSSESRVLRSWRVQESGVVGAVKIAVPSGTGGGTPVYVVVSNDALLDGSDTWRVVTPLTVGTTSYLAADVDFTTGQYFTFATVPPEDYGDAAASYGTLTSTGARHAIGGYDMATSTATLMLGTRVDAELNGLASTAADADDTTGADDDDGVVFPSLSAGRPASLTVTVTNGGPAARLNAWADWNGNGSFTDVGEQIATDLAVSAGSNTVNLTVSPGAVGVVTFRFRLSTQTGLGPTGAAADGEVEDYQVVLGAAETALTITKTDGQVSYVPGASIAYTITVTNAGPANASGISIADSVPASIAGLSVSCVATGSASCGTNATAGNNVSFTGASVAVGTGNQLTLTLQGTVNASTTGNLTNTAAVALGPNQTDSNTTDNTAIDIDAQGPSETNLEITKTGPATVMVGENVTYIITVTNHGPSIATNVVVTDPTPAGLTFVSTGTGCTTAFPCALGTMAPGDVRQISATYRVEPGYPTATPIANTASVSGSETDPTPGNNSQLATTTALPSADVEVLKSVDNSTPLVGQTVTFTVSVLNHGPSDATGIAVRDVLPSELTLGTATPSQGTYDPVTGLWTVGSVPLNGSATLTLAATVNASGSVTNLAVKTAQTEPDPKSGNDSGGATLTGVPSADIWVDKAVDRSMALVGENVTFTVSVTNRGPSPATGIAVDDVLPAGLSLVSTTPSQGAFDPATGVWTVGNLTATGQATLTMVTTLTQPGAMVNQASIRTADQHDPDPLNNTFAASVNSQANADILVIKTVSNTAPSVGANVTYTIAATNLGPSDATVVEILDTLPAGLVFVSASPSQGTYDQTTGMWSAGPLANTATAILTITATVAQNGAIDNTATRIPGAPVDPNANNDSQVATLTAGREADLALTKTPSSPTVGAGMALGWTIVVSNNGPSPVTNATVTDTFQAAFLSPTWTCAASSGSSCGALSGSGNIATTVSLLAGGTATFTVTGLVDPSATALGNTAVVWPPADTTDPATGNNSHTSTVTVVASADLQITKTGPSSARPRATIAYTITVTNAGPSSATSVIVNDPTPAGLTFAGNAGACTTLFPCALGTIAPGETRTITATYTVTSTPTPSMIIANTASVSSAVPDAAPANSTSTVTTEVRRTMSCDVNGDGIEELVTGAGPGGGPHVRVWNFGADRYATELTGFFGYDPAFPGGITVACRDVTGDGVAEIITGAGPGGGPHVRVWSIGADRFATELTGFFAYSPYFPGGVRVAAADVTGDGVAEIITGAGPGGGPHIRVWSLTGGTVTEVTGFWGDAPGVPTGMFVGAGDVDGDGVAEIVTGPGIGSEPSVRVWSIGSDRFATLRASFYAYDPAFPGGASVAVGDLDGDGVAEVITGAGPGGGPHVRVWQISGNTATEVFGFFAYSPYFPGGTYVAAGDMDGDGIDELITGAGFGGGPHVRVWKITGGVLTEYTGYFAYHPAFPGGALVGR